MLGGRLSYSLFHLEHAFSHTYAYSIKSLEPPSFNPCFYFLRNKLELRLPTLIIEILSNKPFHNFQRLLYIDTQLLHSFYILCGGLINHALKDKSRMHIWIVNMRSLTALVHRKRQQHCLRQWMNGSWPEYSRMNLWNPQHAQTICLLSRKLNHTLLSLPPSLHVRNPFPSCSCPSGLVANFHS